jgi:hypothetical protein
MIGPPWTEISRVIACGLVGGTGGAPAQTHVAQPPLVWRRQFLHDEARIR